MACVLTPMWGWLAYSLLHRHTAADKVVTGCFCLEAPTGTATRLRRFGAAGGFDAEGEAVDGGFGSWAYWILGHVSSLLVGFQCCRSTPLRQVLGYGFCADIYRDLRAVAEARRALYWGQGGKRMWTAASVGHGVPPGYGVTAGASDCVIPAACFGQW